LSWPAARALLNPSTPFVSGVFIEAHLRFRTLVHSGVPALAARAARPYTPRPAFPSRRERTPVMAATAHRIHALPALARRGVPAARARRCRR
jgi:hypothetical protein